MNTALRERFRHIAQHQQGPLTTGDGVRWYPAELLELLKELDDAEAALTEWAASFQNSPTSIDLMRENEELMKKVLVLLGLSRLLPGVDKLF